MRISDWSSDVCSSDLDAAAAQPGCKTNMGDGIQSQGWRKCSVVDVGEDSGIAELDAGVVRRPEHDSDRVDTGRRASPALLWPVEGRARIQSLEMVDAEALAEGGAQAGGLHVEDRKSGV